ncbi:MAG: ECF transporter S component [archaeon GBS-70-058]|nr:ECF transporter S component [Candidatus Culexarchaeum nevadense]
MSVTSATNNSQRIPYSLKIVLTSLCAALYAIGSYFTAYIQSPWGMGQFRPAVVIPALFATIFGPWVAGVGAAIGTLICDSIKHGTLYLGSLIAAVPGNFIGFSLFGYITRRRFNWEKFILASNIALIVGNLITAFLYIFVYKFLFAQALIMPFEALTILSIGLMLFWFITMLPFVLLITPPLIRIISITFPSIVPMDVREASLKSVLPRRSFGIALISSGVFTLLIGILISFSPLGIYLSTTFRGYFPPLVMDLFQLLLYLCGIVLSLLGLGVLGLNVVSRR